MVTGLVGADRLFVIFLCTIPRLSRTPRRPGEIPFINNVTAKPVLETHSMARLKDRGQFKSFGDVLRMRRMFDEEFMDESCSAFVGRGDIVGGSLTVDDFDSLPVGADRPSHFCSMRKVQDFMARSREALILTDAQGKISAINKPWFDMCGYTADEVEGKTCAVLQGVETDMEAVVDFDQRMRNREEAETTVINYKKGEACWWSRGGRRVWLTVVCLCEFLVHLFTPLTHPPRRSSIHQQRDGEAGSGHALHGPTQGPRACSSLSAMKHPCPFFQ